MVQQALDKSLGTIARSARLARELLMSEESPSTDLTQPLLDAASLFETLGIRYALVGGLAAMFYGRARFTLDVDFIAQHDHQAILAANPDAMREHHFDPTCTWKLYHDTGGEVDLWKDGFADAIVERARVETLAGRPIRIAEPHDLIAMKLRADRPQDDYDIAEMLKHRPIDDATVKQRVTPEQYDRFQQIKRRIGRP